MKEDAWCYIVTKWTKDVHLTCTQCAILNIITHSYLWYLWGVDSKNTVFQVLKSLLNNVVFVCNFYVSSIEYFNSFLYYS